MSLRLTELRTCFGLLMALESTFYKVLNFLSAKQRGGLSQVRHTWKRTARTMQIMQKEKVRFCWGFCESSEKPSKTKGGWSPPFGTNSKFKRCE